MELMEKPFRSTWVHPRFLVGFVLLCMFCRLLIVLFFFWPLCCLFLDLRILITSLVSTHSDYLFGIYSFWLPLWYLYDLFLTIFNNKQYKHSGWYAFYNEWRWFSHRIITIKKYTNNTLYHNHSEMHTNFPTIKERLTVTSFLFVQDRKWVWRFAAYLQCACIRAWICWAMFFMLVQDRKWGMDIANIFSLRMYTDMYYAELCPLC